MRDSTYTDFFRALTDRFGVEPVREVFARFGLPQFRYQLPPYTDCTSEDFEKYGRVIAGESVVKNCKA